MRLVDWISVLLLLLLWALPWQADACVPSCQCTMVEGNREKGKDKGRKVECSKHPAPFTSLDGLTFPADTVFLDLKKNSLTILKKKSFPGLPKLQKLYLGYNKLTVIEAGAFEGLNNLKRLDLSHNSIGSINSTMFTGLPKLEKLSLSHNLINTIPDGTFNDLTSLRRVDFNTDFLRCDCNLSWIVRWSKKKKVRLSPSTVCALPKEMKGVVVNRLRSTDLHCKHGLQLPYFKITPSQSQIVFSGDKLPLDCQATIIHPNTNITWQLGKTLIQTNKSAGIIVHTLKTPDRISHTLMVERLQKSHSGTWKCQVSTPQGKELRRVEITVIDGVEKVGSRELQCPNVTKVTNKGNYTWETTLAGFRIHKACVVGGPDLYATHFCNYFGYWEDLNLDQCDYVSNLTRFLRRLSQSDYNSTSSLNTNLQSLETALLRSKRAVARMDVIDVVFVADIMEQVLDHAPSNFQLSSVLHEVVSNMTSVQEEVLKGAQLQGRACSRLTGLLSEDLQRVHSEPPHHSQGVFAPHVASMVFQESPSSPIRIQCVLQKPHVRSSSGGGGSGGGSGGGGGNGGEGGRGGRSRSGNAPYTPSLFTCSRLRNDTQTPSPSSQRAEAWLDLPPTLLSEAGLGEGEEANVQVTVYRSAALFPATHTGLGSRGNWSVVTNVITADLGKPVPELKKPVVLGLEVADPSRPLRAAHWVFDTEKGQGQWETDKCSIISKSGNISVIHCYVLSSYAIMQDQSGSRPPTAFVLEPVMYVGSCICILCMIIVIITYVTCFRFIYIPKKMKHSVINICISVLMLMVAFTMGINRIDLNLACQIAGIAIHYLTLCAIFWITITSNNMFKKFTKAERPPSPPPEPVSMPLPPKPILRFYFLGWGVPIIICGITAAVNFNFYAGLEYCYLAWEPSLGAFYGPVALLVVLNLIFFMRISCVIRGASSSLNETDETEDLHVNEIELVPSQADTNLETQSLTQPGAAPAEDDAASSVSVLDQERRPITQLRALVATLFLFILAWVCGAMAVAKPFKSIIPHQELIFSYLYGLASALLGIFMVAYFCLTRQDSRLSWKRFFACKAPETMYSLPADSSTDPPTQVTQVSQMNGSVVKSSSSIEINEFPSKSSNIAKAYNLKNNSSKQSNLNLMPVANSSLTEASFASSNGDPYPNFYNPRQNGAAKKFWEKKHQHHSKIMNKDVNRDLTGSLTDNASGAEGGHHSRCSQATSSDAKSHVSIEIQIQSRDGRSGSFGAAGSHPLGSSSPHMTKVPLNIHPPPPGVMSLPLNCGAMMPMGATASPDLGGGPGRTLVPIGEVQPLPQHQRSPSACSLGGGHPSAFTPVGPRNNTLPRHGRSPGSSEHSNEGQAPRLRDFDGQSQNSDQGGHDPRPLQLPLPSFLPGAPGMSAGGGSAHISSILKPMSPVNNVNVCSDTDRDSAVHSPGRPPASFGGYSSDSSHHQSTRRNLIPHSHSRGMGPGYKSGGEEGGKDCVLSDSPSVDSHGLGMGMESDGQLQHCRQRRGIESDHHSDPTHRKRHRNSHDRFSRHRGMLKQRSLGWEEQFKDRPRKISYAYVNHNYQQRVLQKLIQQASESEELARKAFWLPRSMSEYDRLTQANFGSMLEDSSSSTDDDESFDNVWLPQEKDPSFKKETSV